MDLRLDGLSENTRIALVGIVALGAVVLIEARPWQPVESSAIHVSPNRAIAAAPRPLIVPAHEQRLREETSASIGQLNPELERMMEEGEYGALNDRLLNLAAGAVTDDRSGQLVEILSLLGKVAIAQGQLDSAEVYLFEALDLLGDRASGPEGAEVYLQLGRTYLRSREIARSAGYSYDALQIGRNQLNKGQLDLAEQNIRLAIEHSLSINRYNAAASGYQSLAVFYERLGDQYQGEQARLEAARLFSSSGQESAAQHEIDILRGQGVEDWRLQQAASEIAENLATYEKDIARIGAARDYQRLYHYYLSENNLQRAWHFRLLASKSLEGVSKRTLFHRQQGVLALLYNSNDAMALAKQYFNQASDNFVRYGLTERRQQSDSMRNGIY